MAHRKAGGSASNLKDSNPQYLGVKIFGGQLAQIGNIIIRQRGSKFHAGSGVSQTKDDTLMATIDGVVKFTKRKVRDFTGKLVKRQYVHVVPKEETEEVKK